MGSSSSGMLKKLIGKNPKGTSFTRRLQFDSFALVSLELSSEYAATRKQFTKSLSEFGMIQVRSPLAQPSASVAMETSSLFVSVCCCRRSLQ